MTWLGDRLYRLSRRPPVLGSSILLALLAATLSVCRPSLHPLGLQQRHVQVAAASTELLIGRPSALPDNSLAYDSSVNTALLAANLMISPAVTDVVGRKLGIDPSSIEGDPPTSNSVPAALIQPGPAGGPQDILAAPDHYKLGLQQDPTAPILFLYTQAPTGAQAVKLANAAAQALIAYLAHLQAVDHVPVDHRLSIEQLGRADGGTAHTAGVPQIFLLVFGAASLLTLPLCSWLACALERRGWSWLRAQRALRALAKIATNSSA